MASILRKTLWEHRLLLFILFFGLCVRQILYLGILRGDDVGYYYLAYKLATDGLETTAWGGQERIGLYYPVAFLIRWFGASELVATLLPLVASLLTIVFVYGIASKLHNQKSGILAAFLWAVFPLDTFLATQLLPDGPSAMAATGSVYFFLVAEAIKSRIFKYSNYLLSTGFFLWAFLIKESMVTLIFIILGLAIYDRLGQLRALFQRYLGLPSRVKALLFGVVAIPILGGLVFLGTLQTPLWLNTLELTSVDISDVLVLGRLNPIHTEQVGGAYWILDRPVFTPTEAPNVFTVPANGVRVEVLDAYILLFIVSAAGGLLQRKGSAFHLILLWFAISFLYLEWGSYPRGIYFPGMFVYMPITHWIDARNLISLSVPIVVAIGLYLSSFFSERALNRFIFGSALVTLLMLLALRSPLLADLSLSIMYLAKLLALSAVVLLPFALNQGIAPSWRQALGGVLIGLVALASQLPSPNYHVSDYGKEQAVRQNLKDVTNYLETQPELPIYGVDGSLGLLDVYAGFEFGYDHLGIEPARSEERVVGNPDLLGIEGGYKIRFGCDQPIASLLDWPVREFGDLPNCVSLTRIFEQDQLSQELLRLKNLAQEDPSRENIDLYLAVSAQAGDINEFIHALSLYATFWPENSPLVQASQILSAEDARRTDPLGRDLLAEYIQCTQDCRWSFDRRLDPEIIATEVGPVLSIQLADKTDEPQSIDLGLSLLAGGGYLLEIEMRSFAPFELLQVNDGQIPDSYKSTWDRKLDWTTYQIIFVMPAGETPVQDTTLQLAHVLDRGSIEFRSIKLYQLGTED